MRDLLKFVALVVLFAAVPAFADSVTFDLEGNVATGISGSYTSLSQTVGGLTMTVTRVGGTPFDIADLSATIAGPNTWGSSSLSSFYNTSSSPFVFTFSQPVSSFSIQLGDLDVDYDTQSGTAYSGPNGTGTALATFGGTWADGDLSAGDLPETDSISAAGIESVVFMGGSVPYPNSLYYDNITVTVPNTAATPEPGSLLLLLTGTGGLAGLRLRRRRV